MYFPALVYSQRAWPSAEANGRYGADRPADKAAITSGRSEVLRSLGHDLQAPNHNTKHHRSLGGESCRKKQRSTTFLERKRRTLELIQRQIWGNFSGTGWNARELFQARRYHLETEVNRLGRSLLSAYTDTALSLSLSVKPQQLLCDKQCLYHCAGSEMHANRFRLYRSRYRYIDLSPWLLQFSHKRKLCT